MSISMGRESQKVPAPGTQQKKDKEENWITSLPFDLEPPTKRVAILLVVG